MAKLAKYLKPYVWQILLCVILLFGQAMCDLNLPNFMSDIVNVGIQQSGIEEPLPKAVSEEGYRLISVFVTAQDREALSGVYRLVETGSEEARQRQSEYPLLATRNVYILEESAGQPALDSAADAYGTGAMTFLSFMKEMGSQDGGELSGELSSSNLETVDFDSLYQVLPMLEQMPS